MMNQKSAKELGQSRKPLEEISDEWFVNRQKYLDFFWEWGRGQRRDGCDPFLEVGGPFISVDDPKKKTGL